MSEATVSVGTYEIPYADLRALLNEYEHDAGSRSGVIVGDYAIIDDSFDDDDVYLFHIDGNEISAADIRTPGNPVGPRVSLQTLEESLEDVHPDEFLAFIDNAGIVLLLQPDASFAIEHRPDADPAGEYIVFFDGEESANGRGWEADLIGGDYTSAWYFTDVAMIEADRPTSIDYVEDHDDLYVEDHDDL